MIQDRSSWRRKIEIEDLKHLMKNQVQHNDSHSVHRELYAILVYDLWRDPVEAIQMMAIWIWMERIMGLPDLTRMILSLSSNLVQSIGDEALLYWACVENISLLSSSLTTKCPLTNILLKKDMPIEFIRNHHELTIAGINDVVTSVCAIYFKDIWDGAIARDALMDFSQKVANHESGFPHKNGKIPPDERTLFVTFSRGQPVPEWELREFFTTLFDKCIESFYMPEVATSEHPLFAKIVLHENQDINKVLTRGTKTVFIINGKQVWVRKFIPKCLR